MRVRYRCLFLSVAWGLALAASVVLTAGVWARMAGQAPGVAAVAGNTFWVTETVDSGDPNERTSLALDDL